MTANHRVQATPDCAWLFVLAQVPGSPDADLLGRMKTLVTLALFAYLAVGCAQLPKNHRVASLNFRGDPVDHRAEEAVEQIEIVAPSARVHRVGKLPTDWSADVSGQQDGPVKCTLSCAHQSFAEPDIHAFGRLVTFLVPKSDALSEDQIPALDYARTSRPGQDHRSQHR